MSIAQIAAGRRALACLTVAAAVLAAAPRAQAQAEDPAVIDKITKMNKKAVEEYENLNFEEARKILKAALDLCSQSGLDKHPIKARTHIHLGVVILAGFKERDLALKQFKKALEIQPDIKLTKSLANPEVQEAFDEASASAGKPEPDVDKPPPEKPPEPEKPSGPFEHQTITAAVQGKAIVVKASTDGSLGAKKFVLGYRAGSAGDFLGREMKEVSPGRWQAEIPATATNGDRVSYYVDAQNDDGDSLASKGTADDPLIITLRGAGAPADSDGGDDDDDDDDEGAPHPWFVGVALGSGFGWATGNGEVNVEHKISPAGFARAGLGHVSPEVGYFVQPKLLVSVQLRYQYVTGPTPEMAPAGIDDCGDDRVCQPAKYALAGFAKATWFVGDGKFRPYVAGAVGGGYIRHVAEFVSAGKVCGPPSNDKTCVDTVAAGPILLGPAAGFFYSLSDAFALTVAANSYLGFPTFTFHLDLNAGIALGF